jgi:hypothetical protein
VNIDHRNRSSVFILERTGLALQPLGADRPKRLTRVA